MKEKAEEKSKDEPEKEKAKEKSKDTGNEKRNEMGIGMIVVWEKEMVHILLFGRDRGLEAYMEWFNG